MKQRMEVIRQESAKEALSAATAKSTDEQESTVDLSDVDRFLNDKFK
jgi:hypothetical protein